MERINILVEESRRDCKEAKEELLRTLKPLILSSIKRYHRQGRDYDELLQEGYLLILEALLLYDPAYKVHFLAFIKSKLKYYFLNKNKERGVLSLNNICKESEQEFIEILEDERNYEDLLVEKFQIVKVKKNIEDLSKRERQVIYLAYYKDLSNKEISKKLGISYQTVANTKNRALKKLKFLVKN